MAGGGEPVERLAGKLFDALETYMHDERFGGYREFLRRDWSAPGDDARRYTDPHHYSLKTVNAHLHLLEAMTPYYQVAPSPLVHERLLELIDIQTNKVYRSSPPTSYDCLNPDWTPAPHERNEHCSYGHDLENVHLVLDAYDAAGLSTAPVEELLCSIYDHALWNGFDWSQGGWYLYGSDNPRLSRF